VADRSVLIPADDVDRVTLRGVTRERSFFRRMSLSLITLVPFDLERPNSIACTWFSHVPTERGYGQPNFASSLLYMDTTFPRK